MNEPKRANPERESDHFVKWLQGAAVRVIVGANTANNEPHSYILPQALLTVESGFFKSEFAKRRRRLHDANGANPTTKDKSLDQGHTPDKNPGACTVPIIYLPECDQDVFALFVICLYQGQYRPCYIASSFPITADNVSMHAFHHWPEAPEQCAKYVESKAFVIPAPMLAHQLGTELSSLRLIHFSMTMIYNDVGTRFSITPAIVSWVLNCTPRDGPLRRFVLDVLIQCWNNVQTLHVAKPMGVLKDGWDKLFQNEKELTREFIFGMGPGGRRVQVLQSYLTLPVVMPTGQPAANPTSAVNAGNANSQRVAQSPDALGHASTSGQPEPKVPVANEAVPKADGGPPPKKNQKAQDTPAEATTGQLKPNARAASEAAPKVDGGPPPKKQKVHASSPAAATPKAAPTSGNTLIWTTSFTPQQQKDFEAHCSTNPQDGVESHTKVAANGTRTEGRDNVAQTKKKSGGKRNKDEGGAEKTKAAGPEVKVSVDLT